METERKFKPRKRSQLKKWLLMSVMINLVLVLACVWLWRGLRLVQSDPTLVSKKEVADVVREVSKLIVLPEGEAPTLATVADAESLRGKQPFFASAENGDKVLLYSNAVDPSDRKAYLYRPSTKQLLNVAPVNIGGQVQSLQDVFSIEIRNGTSVEGLADRMGDLIAQVFPNVDIVRKSNAAESNYDQSFFVTINGSVDLTRKIASIFNAPVQDLPEIEEKPDDVDVLLILGSKKSPEADADTGEESVDVAE